MRMDECYIKGTIYKCDEYKYWIHDARGIHLCKACNACEKEKLNKYRPDVLTDPNYIADERIEPDA